MSSRDPVLEVQNLAKRYGAVTALDGVDLTVRQGEVQALLGENGAGKSTLLKVLAGVVTPDSGTLRFAGAAYAPRGPRDARERGVAMIHQELALALDQTVAENITLGQERRRPGLLGRLGVVDRRARASAARAALGRLGRLDLDPETRVGALGPGDRQMVEIARALASDARVLILDEPTSSLAADDVARLFDVLKGLARDGVAVLYVSHFLEEVRAVATGYTVLRDGRSVATGALSECDDVGLVAAMAGRAVAALYPPRSSAAWGQRDDRGTPALVARGLRTARLARPVDVELRAGEVLGIAGLVGAGRTELLRGLFGLDPLLAGELRRGAASDRGVGPRARVRQGLGFLSEDRKGEGLALTRSLVENATLSRLSSVATYGIVRRGAQAAAARALFERLGVRYRSVRQPAGSLSGGNQQKIALARLLFQQASVLLLDEPTRGVDVGSRAEIYSLIRELAGEGAAILMSSSYLPELLGTCDRIAVMRRGALGPARPVTEWTEHSLLMAATGASAEVRA